MPLIEPERGEVWEVRFDPSEGDEMRKIRPAVVMTAGGAGRMRKDCRPHYGLAIHL